MIHVAAAKYVREKIVWLSFDDGAAGEVDLTEHLVGSVFEPLRETDEFRKVLFSSELETIVWPNGADFVKTRTNRNCC